MWTTSTCMAHFYPHSPCGERRARKFVIFVTIAISIHTLLAESDITEMRLALDDIKISIHALLAESDLSSNVWSVLLGQISIHALLAESDHCRPGSTGRPGLFLSTLSLRRATARRLRRPRHGGYFYPRSPCGERHRAFRRFPRRTQISIHALLAESDSLFDLTTAEDSTISIHALLAESDQIRQTKKSKAWEFLSTLSLRRATACFATSAPSLAISIHALLAESD